MSKNDLEDQVIMDLGEVLDKTNRSVTDLDVSDNSFGSAGGAAVLRALDRRILERLNLSMNNLNVVESFGKLREPRRLRTSLQDYKNMMSDLSSNLEGSKLSWLDMSFCNLGDGLAEAVATVIECSDHTMEHIDLSSNGIGELGAEGMVKSMEVREPVSRAE